MISKLMKSILRKKTFKNPCAEGTSNSVTGKNTERRAQLLLMLNLLNTVEPFS